LVEGYNDVSGSINAFASRLEDTEDDMKVCQNDVDVLKLEQASMGRDIRMLEALMGSVHKQLEGLGDRMDEAVASETAWRVALEEKVAFLEEKLTDSLLRSSDLVNLVLALQNRVGEIEDAVMEESEGSGPEVVSSSSSDLDPIENMVAIPVPAPSVIHMLVVIPEEYIPPVLRSSSGVPSTPSPEYVQALEDDPAHDGTPEYWADPEAGVDH
jgi:hypothetical protein